MSDQNPIEAMSEVEAKRLLNEIADRFSIGEFARSPSTILTNLDNSLRRERCLSMIEAHHTETVPDEDGLGEDAEVSLLNWGESPENYIETYKAVLEEQAKKEPCGDLGKSQEHAEVAGDSKRIAERIVQFICESVSVQDTVDAQEILAEHNLEHLICLPSDTLVRLIGNALETETLYSMVLAERERAEEETP